MLSSSKHALDAASTPPPPDNDSKRAAAGADMDCYLTEVCGPRTRIMPNPRPGSDVFVFVDIETSGANPLLNYMMQLGAVAFIRNPSTDPDAPIALPVSAYTCSLGPPPGHPGLFEPRCKREFWSQPNNAARLPGLLATAVPPREAIQGFVDWVNGFQAANVKWHSDCPQFDLGVLGYYCCALSDDQMPVYLLRVKPGSVGDNRFFEAAICTDTMIRALTKDVKSNWVSTEGAAAKLGWTYAKCPKEYEHDALYDALYIGVNYFRMLKACNFQL